MKFAIITHVQHIQLQNQYFAYSPYVNEMNVWSKYIDELIIVAPIQNAEITAIDWSYNSNTIQFVSINKISLLGLRAVLNAILKAPKISWQIFKAMQQADHIHLRCPGNIGLLGCLVQILFPNKPKTAKYAGNWDPKAKQPWSYRLQKWILSNTFLTRNMLVLVYGEWDGSTKNIKPFFTATYSETDKIPIPARNFENTIHFIFIGTLAAGKNPMYAIELIDLLLKKGHKASLAIYGDGIQKTEILNYIKNNNLESQVMLYGNQSSETLKIAYQKSHFVILPSESEGWPKAIAEGMFWGCVPLVTPVSCVPYMLDYGKRGLFLSKNTQEDAIEIEKLLNDVNEFNKKSQQASDWSRQYTLEVFEKEIRQLLLS